MAEYKKGGTVFKILLWIGLGIGGTLFYFNYFVTPEYRETADRFLEPQTATLITNLKKTKGIMVSNTQFAKRYATPEYLREGMLLYNSAATSQNAYIEMMIVSFDTGFDDVTFEELIKQQTSAKEDIKKYDNWVTDKNNYLSQTNEPRHQPVAVTTTAFVEVLGEASKAVNEAVYLKENIREQRVKRMIENFRSCQLPSWEEINAVYSR